MSNLTTRFVRKPFYVDAVQVTEENMAQVAKWCGGEIRTTKPRNQKQPVAKFIKVNVARPMSERQTMGFIGDWVIFAGAGYKVYNNIAFGNSFDKAVGGEIGEHAFVTVYENKNVA